MSTCIALAAGCPRASKDSEAVDLGAEPGATNDLGVVNDSGGGCTGLTLGPGDYDQMLTHASLQRTFHLHVPPSYGASTPVPLVLVFHGAGGNAANNERISHWEPESDRAGFIVVEPDGTGKTAGAGTWNAGSCCGEALDNQVDDVGFVRDLITFVSSETCIDSRRIFATGFSNGGAMTQRLGCELSDKIAAIAPVSGLLLTTDLDVRPTRQLFTCAPRRPVPVLEFHGTEDKIVLYGGGKSSCLTGSPTFPSVPDTIAGWRMRNGCASTFHVTLSQGAATCTGYDSCAQGADTILCTLTDEGHAWPGGTPPAGGAGCAGPWTQIPNATRMIWDFFSTHPLS